MTLVQSGQDTEMGTAKCALHSGTDAKKAANNKENTLDEFLGVKERPPTPSVSACNDYEKFGIFNGVAFEGSDCPFPTNSDFNVASAAGVDVFDLETGLALSHADLDLQRALEKSRSEVSQSSIDVPVAASRRDEDMERAIAASMRENSASASTATRAAGATSATNDARRQSFSGDIEKAIKLSLGMDQNHRASSAPTIVGVSANDAIDLSSPPVATRRHPSPPTERERRM